MKISKKQPTIELSKSILIGITEDGQIIWRATNLPVFEVLGLLEIAKQRIIQEATSDNQNKERSGK